MRIVTYNFLAGGGPGRVAWAALQRLAPDLLLGQECRPPPPGAPLAGLWAPAGGGRWGTGLFLARGAARPIEVPGFGGWVVGGELARDAWLSERPLRVFSVHCPSGDRGYVRSMHALLDAMAKVSVGADLVLGGDFNVAAGVRGARDVVRFSAGERLLLARMADELALIPCWQTAHPRSALAQTLRWSGNRATPYHCDGIFVPRALRPKLLRCEVLSGARWDRLSDHNPVVADLGEGAARRRRSIAAG